MDELSQNLHVVTENGEQCFMWRSNQLTYIAQDRRELPLVLATKFGPLATKLDLSYNSLSSYTNIQLFTNLSELILDNNCLEDGHLEFKQNLRLKTLSLNKNKLRDLNKLVNGIKISYPNLEFLSLIGNPLCPSLGGCHGLENNPSECDDRIFAGPIDGPLWHGEADLQAPDNEFAYQRYRYFIIYHLPNLRFLDSTPINEQERDEALRRCYWMSNLNSNNNVVGSFGQNHSSIQVPPTTTATTNGLSQTNGSNNDDQLVRGPLNSSHQPSGPISDGNDGYDNDRAELLTIMSDYDGGGQSRPTTRVIVDGRPKGAFSRLSHKYTGKNSEGNRFIRNQDL